MDIKRDKGGKLGSLILIILLILFVFNTAEAEICTYTISPTNQSFSSNGDTDSISVTTQSGCSWAATGTLDWVSIASGSSGTGSGTVTYSVLFNNTGQPRKGTVTIGDQTFTIRQAKSVFNDVTDPTYWAYPYIYAIYTEGITVGCGNNNYCPNDQVTRGQMAAFIIRAKYGENFTYTQIPYFSDVPQTHVFFKYVQKLKDDGITVVSGIYGVDNYVTRGQMAAFIIRAKYGENFTYTQTPYFSDVPSIHGFFKYVQKLKDDGITTVTGTYDVDSVVTREQMAAFLARAFLGMQLSLGRFRLTTRGLWVQFERRGYASEYWPGQAIQDFNNFDSVVGHTVAEEVALQLDTMRAMGINTITMELRTSDPVYIPDPFVPPECNLGPGLGFQWPQPTPTELSNLSAFLNLVHNKGIRLMLMLNNTHMEEQPPTNSETWLGAILGTVKDHPAIDLICFGGNLHVIDTDGDEVPDACGIPAEPPFWMGPTTVGSQYVKWAIGYGLSLGISANKLSAEAAVGDFFTISQPPNRWGTDGHLWSPIVTLKRIFDDLGIPNSERTYALSFYEHRKCATARDLPCTDTDLYTWADQIMQSEVFATIGTGNGARVVFAEMGKDAGWPPVDPAPTQRVLEHLFVLLEKYGIDGGSFWRWTSFSNDEDTNPQMADPVKRRGVEFIYNPVQKEVIDMGGFHLTTIPNGSFEMGDSVPSNWTVGGNGTGLRYFLPAEPGQPEVPTRGNYALRLVTGSGPNDAINATSDIIAVTPNTTYTTTSNLRFSWSGDPNPQWNSTTRPQVFISIQYFDGYGRPSQIRTQDVFRFYQENSTNGFETFPLQYTIPSDANFVRIEVGAARNGLSTAITFDVDNLR